MPSSRSIISSARASASRLTSAEGWCRRTASWLIKKKPRRGGAFSRSRLVTLVEFHAFFFEVTHRAGMPRDPARRRGFLALQLEVLGFLVYADQLLALLENRLHDVVGGLLVHVLVG